MSSAGKGSEENEKEGAAAEAAPAKSKKKLIIGVVAGLLVIGGGGGAFMMMSGGEAPPVVAEEDLAPILKMAKIDTFIANLSENSAFVKVGIVIEYDQRVLDRMMDGSADGGGHAYGGGAAGGGAAADPFALPHLMVEREPMIRDAIIKTLSSRRSSDILSNEGKEELREALVAAINEAISDEEHPVVQVYFTEFVIQ